MIILPRTYATVPKYRILQKVMPVRKIRYFYVCVYSTVTDLARLRGWSTSFPLHTAIW